MDHHQHGDFIDQAEHNKASWSLVKMKGFPFISLLIFSPTNFKLMPSCCLSEPISVSQTIIESLASCFMF